MFAISFAKPFAFLANSFVTLHSRLFFEIWWRTSLSRTALSIVGSVSSGAALTQLGLGFAAAAAAWRAAACSPD